MPDDDNEIKRLDSWSSYETAETHLKKVTSLWKEARELSKQGKGNIGKSFQMNIRMEQAPNPKSRVSLSEEKDSLGVPRVHLNWDLTPLDKRSIRTIHYLIGRELAISGYGRLKLRKEFSNADDYLFPKDTHGGNHHMGTTRMDEDPKKGVVDINCKLHGIDNLFVAGSACFPTAGAPNPTLTIVALSLRLSDFIKDKMK